MATPDPAHPAPQVRETLATKTLSFSASAIQSRMRLQQPDALDLEYTRLMTGFAMFHAAPVRMAMIGLGGGSIAKFCHRYLPRVDLTVIEVNPQVIALRDAFRVPPESERFRIVEADGAAWVASTDLRCDVLLVDAFDADGTPPALCTQRFYDDCVDVLNPAGVLVVNLHASHPLSAAHVERIARSCGAPVLRVDDHDGTNAVVFGRRGAAVRAVLPAGRQPRGWTDDAWQQIAPAHARIAAMLARQDGG